MFQNSRIYLYCRGAVEEGTVSNSITQAKINIALDSLRIDLTIVLARTFIFCLLNTLIQ